MEILAIEIENLASLSGSHLINFQEEPLVSAGIFAITGPTGSGKSTILDALCLALYGKTPRYHGAKETGVNLQDVGGTTLSQNDPAAILHRGAAHGQASVSFVAKDGIPYKATWSIRRARNKPDGRLQAPETALVNLNSNRPIPGKKRELEALIQDLIGLTFEQFTRSVLLAQGEFTAFLKADKTAKADLLEKLTGTEIYSEISKKIFDRHKTEEQQLKEMELQQKGVVILSSEEIETIEKRKVELRERIEVVEKQLAQMDSEIKWHLDGVQFNARVSEAVTALAEAKKAEEATQVERQELQWFMAAQPAKNLLETHVQTQQQCKGLTQEIHQIEGEVVRLQKAVTESDANQLALQTRVVNTKRELELAQPLLEQAQRLDVQIEEKTQTYKKLQIEAKKHTALAQSTNKKLVEKSAELADVKNTLFNSQLYKENHASKLPLVDHHLVIQAKLTDLQSHWLEKKEAQDQSSKATASYKAAEKLRGKNAEALHTKEAELAHLEKITHETKAAIPEFDEKKLHQLQAEKQEALATWRDAAVRWKNLYRLQQDLSELEHQKEKVTTEKNTVAHRIESSTGYIQQLQTEQQAAQKALDLARLAAAKDTDVLRTQLIPGAPCMVCGSTHHPYMEGEIPALDAVFKRLQENVEAITKTVDQARAQHNSDTATFGHLETQLQGIDLQIARNRDAIDKETPQWEAFSGFKKAVTWPEAERMDTMDQHIATLQTASNQIAIQMEHLQQAKAAYEKSREASEAARSIWQELKTATREAEVQTEQALERQKVQEERTAQINKKVTVVVAELTPYFESQDWLENWKSNPVGFQDRLRKFVDAYQKNEATLVKAQQAVDVLTSEIQYITQQEKEAQHTVRENEVEVATLQKALQTLEVERKGLFDGRALEHVKEGFAHQLKTAEENFEKAHQETTRTKDQWLKTQTTLEQLHKQLEKLVAQEVTQQKQLQEWLFKFNAQQQTTFTFESLATLLDKPSDWQANLAAALQEIDNRVIQRQASLEERQKQLREHESKPTSKVPLEELKVQCNTLKVQSSGYHEENGDLNRQLQDDQKNKQQLKRILHAIEKQREITEDWGRLKDLIGSAEGDKFKRIAQEYTLDILLRYANSHLNILNNRYELQRIPETLGLQVLDKDMGYEVRTVFSLSGGESFLVSLALALGLASLSSNRIKVTSLFIDEGFGSLDVNTLTIAMDALERLHHDGRKVGVISHVSEMKERIPTQIQVQKQRGGKSSVACVLAN